MAGIPLKRRKRLSTEVDPERCIICQKLTDQSTTSTHDGRTRILKASEIRRDDVTERLTEVESDRFVYHVSNECYKNYTHKTKLEKLNNDFVNKTLDENENCITKNPVLIRPSRSKSKLRKHSLLAIGAYQKKCIICNKRSFKNVEEKHRLSESERASNFLEATLFLQDEVYIRTCDLENETDLFGAHLYYHNSCMLRYLNKYKRDKTHRRVVSISQQLRRSVFDSFIQEVHTELKQGNGFVLSDLRKRINSNMSCGMSAYNNREVKMLLCDRFGSKVQFAYSKEVNKSAMVFFTTVETAEVVDSLRCTDVIEESAKMIRDALLQTDFDLGDKFCDDTDLKHSWYGTYIPDQLLRFFGVLFNFNPKVFYNTMDNQDANSSDEYEPANELEAKRRKMQALHQIMYFNVHNGGKRTPLHIMNAQAIHEKCKSRELITSLNHFGLSISYNELQRYHDDMASLIVQSSRGIVPLPSQFDPEMFTIAAFDNFDHEEATLSGKRGSHDTVSVLFQDKPTNERKKPNISDTNIVHGSKVFQDQLQCQELRQYIKPAKRSELASSYLVQHDLLTTHTDDVNNSNIKDTAWILGRMDYSNGHVCIDNNNQRMPSWSAFNSVISEETTHDKIVGFLPVIPSPVTEYQTVYTALKNFQDVLNQLKQSHLMISCDEGVYHIAREITMRNPAEFDNIVLCLGSFHMTKIFLGCIGKYLRNSGAESIWTESNVFGTNVVQSVLSGTHYVRAFKGINLLCEALERLQWCEFFDQYSTDESYESIKTTLTSLQANISEKCINESKLLIEDFKTSSTNMIKKYNLFRTKQNQRSETFKYWDTFILLVRLLRNLVRADREGNWQLHLSTVQSILPYFAVFDCVNYLRWCSVYLEDMRQLPETAPAVYQNFIEGKFVVKRTPGKFKAVAADLCLEQTINKSQKSHGGIIGSTRQKHFVAEWEIIYHEMIAVSTLHRELSGSKSSYHEITVNHEFNASETKAREANVNDMVKYMRQYENPFRVTADTEGRLHNIITQEIMPIEVRKSILNITEAGLQLYSDFRKERFVDRKKPLHDTIHRNNIKTFNSILAMKSSSIMTKKRKTNETAAGHRIIEIAQERGFHMKELFRYDLVPTNYLFDEDGLMKKPVKSTLCHELEKLIDHEEIQTPDSWRIINTVYLVDVMACLRKVRTTGLRTFGDLCGAFMRMILAVCKTTYRIDFIFDSYLQGSIKDTERIRRATAKPIEINILQEDTPIPVNMQSFWSSSRNKAKLQGLLRNWVIANVEGTCPEIEIVLSGTIGENGFTSSTVLAGGISTTYPQLDLAIEEADVRLIPHAVHATDNGAKRVVLLSGDTDVMVLGLYYFKKLKEHNLQELWMRAGVGDTTRFVPLHLIAEKYMGLCMVLPAVHILTGCDTTSKVGTKLSALKAAPEHLLTDFGKLLNGPEHEQTITMAEKYLVKVLKLNTDCTTMDELRHVMYHQSKAIDIHALPPTSVSIHAHILRCLYTTYVQMHCLENVNVNPLLYGYEDKDGFIISVNIHRNVPENLTQICKCKECSTKRCTCRKAGVPCCIYCSCKIEITEHHCQNPHTVVSVPILF